MHWSLFLLVLLSAAQVARASGYCLPTGCAGSECSCPSFFFHCDTSEDLNGVCTFTSYGVWAVVAIIVLLVVLIALLVFIVCCCCCCRGKRNRDTNINLFHPAGYDAHSVI
jgi:hypothetical protein